MNTSEFLDALDTLAAKKDRIEYFDNQMRYSSLIKAQQQRVFESSLVVYHGADVDRLAAIRRNNDEGIKKIDKKFGKKYWEGLAEEVGLKWLA